MSIKRVVISKIIKHKMIRICKIQLELYKIVKSLDNTKKGNVIINLRNIV